jgi:hypothetical protein
MVPIWMVPVLSKPVKELVTEFFFLFYRKLSMVGKVRQRGTDQESAETVAFCVSLEWCRILPRGISAVRIVFVVFLSFFLPKAESVRTPVWEGMSVGDEDLA